MKNKKIKCDIYTRVSTTMQVDGYSLDAQKEKLKRYAEFQNMEIVNEYSDEGKSGKSVEGRPEFQRMLDNIENGTDEVQFVLVFKLSRFGRNAADVLNSLQRMQDFGVNLICVEDGIDSSKDSGKLMISVLSAVAEIERENILVQTMEGRKQKAREGKWNGGFAPYGYELVNGELQIAEDEAEIIRLIYDKFIHTNMGISAIAAWLNQHGYKKKKRQNNTLDAFASSFIKGVLDNPVYCGKLAYGRRKNEKVSGTRNEYRIVKQENYMLHDGIHEGIVSETDWELAHQKREKTGVKYEKTHSLDHEHILSGILRCPLCGSGMYGNVNRKKKKDGTLYKDYFYYACKHRRLVDGHKCGYRKQWSEEKINNAVEEVIRKLVKNPKFEEAILNKIGSRIDTEEIEKEIEGLEKQHRQLTGAKARLGQQMDSLDIMDKFYEKKYQDMETRLYRLYDEIEGVENSIEEVKNRLLNIQQQKISEENVYQFLLYFDKLYDKFTDLEKKEFLNSFVEQVDIYEQEQPDGRFLKHIKFRFPVYFGDRETQELCWDNESTVEPITGRPNCYQVTLSNLTASFAMNIYDSDCRLLGTIYPTAVYLPPETTSATYNEDTNPVSVTLEIFAPYGVSYNEGETPTAALSYIGFQAGNNMVRQGINLLAIPKMIGFDTDGDTATIGLTVILQSLYYAGYNVASGGKIQTPKGSIVSPDNSDCKQFVAGELLDLAIKPLELGPPKFEQCLKRDYSSPTCGTCSSGEAGSGNNGCPFDTTALTPPEPKVP